MSEINPTPLPRVSRSSADAGSSSGGSLVVLRRAALLIVLGVLLTAAIIWARADLRYRSSAILTQTARLIMAEAILEVGPERIVEAAAKGMTSVLDPYSAYLSPEEYGFFTEETEGEYIGIGVGVRISGSDVVVSDVYPQSPAADAFIRPGDRILSIDDWSAHGASLVDVITHMRGTSGTPVVVSIESAEAGVRRLELVRSEVAIDPFPIVGISRSAVGYIRWSSFSEGSADRLAAIVEDLLVEQPLGLILDLRGNPGGVLDEAVAAAGVFLPPETLVCEIHSSDATDVMELRTPAHGRSTFGRPIIIVQDEMSASAAEVLAAALRDAGRAIIVGQRSFGKGWVQTVFTLGDMGALRLSTARYVTPAGRSLGDPVAARHQYDSLLAGYPVRGVGLHPDLRVESLPVGPWQRALLRDGVFSDFVEAHLDDWAGAGVEDSLELLDDLVQWMDLDKVELDGPGIDLQRQLRDADVPHSVVKNWMMAEKVLAGALLNDAALLLERERMSLLRRLWEERLLRLHEPDPGELEVYFDLDPCLTAARDLLEQPDRYREIITDDSVTAVPGLTRHNADPNDEGFE